MKFEDEKVTERMKTIRHKVLVLSGKGGVGKSTIAVNLATALSVAGKKVGLLDIDVHGPSIPRLLGVEGMTVQVTGESIRPFAIGENLRIMSIGFLLRSVDDAVIWRGPMKIGVIKQFLGDVEWGELDYLVVDCPPGTGDEPLTIAQLIPDADGAVIVTTPQDIALIDVRKCINFCRQLSLPVIGVIENMSGFVCPSCKQKTDIFKSGGGEDMAREMEVPFLGRVPVDPGIVTACDEGKPYVLGFPETETGKILAQVVAPILALDENVKEEVMKENSKRMKIAIPLADGMISRHFGHCEHFALFEVDPGCGKIIAHERIDAPQHEPGLLPVWLKEKGADVVIACGMGMRAQSLFKDNGIEVVVGAAHDVPETIVMSYLAGNIVTGENICDH